MEYDNISLDSLDSYDYAESSDNESENESLENNSDEQET